MTTAAAAPKQQRAPPRKRLRRPKKAKKNKAQVLLELSAILLGGGRFTLAQLKSEHHLEERTAERYLNDLRASGFPIVVEKGDEQRNEYFLHQSRTRMSVEAVDVTTSSAKSLSLLLVAAALLPKNLGVRDAADDTVRRALRLKGMRLATEMRRYEDAVVVLENEAKDYTGREDIFEALFDAVLAGWCVEIDYRSPRRAAPERRQIFPATLGLYRGGLYVLGVDVGDDGRDARWWALERMDDVPIVVGEAVLPAAVRLKAIASAARRWGPVSAKKPASASASTSTSAWTGETLVTLRFSPRAAPYVRARPWHTAVDAEVDDDGGLRVAVRLDGETFLFESWLLSWGAEVQVLRPPEMAERLAVELERAAAGHRAAAAAMKKLLEED
jgi:predicted DNA-binding transcriptional regulator YafY